MPLESSFRVSIRTLPEICVVSATVSVVRASRYASAIGSRNCTGKNRIERQNERETERRISASNISYFYSISSRVTEAKLAGKIDVGGHWTDRTKTPAFPRFFQ